MDPYVLDTPWIVRVLAVYGGILPKRSHESAHAYQQVWTPDGSPLITISKALKEAVQAQVDHPVVLAMRYGNPSILDTLKGLLDQNPDLESLHLIPLYPHYAMSSTQTAVEAVRKAIRALAPHLTLTLQPPFYDDPGYIRALAASMTPYLEKPFDHLLFSYHGLPERHLKKSDPTGTHCLCSAQCCTTPSPAHATCYRAQVYATTRAVQSALQLPNEKISVSFQSRLGRDPWIQPYTDQVIPELAQQGVKRLLVACPAFVSDCLETLEEIQQRGHDLFLKAGGESFEMIPCLNTHPEWVKTVVGITSTGA